jgi:ABC-type uncharacterized transport system auxiliary subunit
LSLLKPFSLWIAAVVVLPGCFGASAPDAQYFTLDAGAAAAPAAAGTASPRSPVRLAIEGFRISPEYATDRIVYRESPYQLGYYNYYRWAASPEILVRRALQERLDASGAFAAVEDAAGMSAPDLFLEGLVERIEEVDGGERWTARLVLELSLHPPAEKATIFRRRYDIARPAASRNPLEVVKAMSAATQDAATGFLADAEKALARRAGSK